MNSNEEYISSLKSGLNDFLNSGDEVHDPEMGSDRYINSQYLATGGMKTIYEVDDLKTGRKLAKAVLNENAPPHVREFFLSEAILTASLSHPNIVSIHDLGEDENGPWFTMELLKGNSLNLNLKNRSMIERLDIFLKICDAVSYAHSQNIIHLDIKPENILIGEFGEVTLCDWGLAKKLSDAENDYKIDLSIGMTLHGEIKGTPGFMAPEQINCEDKTTKTDIFALGSLLYYLSEGEAPFKGESLKEILTNTNQANLQFKNTPLALQAVIIKAVEPELSERYTSVLKLKSEIENYISGFATEAENAGFIKQLKLFYQRNKIISNVILISSFCILFICLFFIKQLSDREAKALNAKNAALEAQDKAILSEQKAIQAREEEAKAKDEALVNLQRFQDEQAMVNMLKQRSNLSEVSDSLMHDFNFDSALKLLEEQLEKNPNEPSMIAKKFNLHFIRFEMSKVLEIFKITHRKHDENRKIAKIAEQYKNEDFKDIEKVAEVLNLVKGYASHYTLMLIYQLQQDRSKEEIALLIKKSILIQTGMNSINFNYNEQLNALDLSNNPTLDQDALIRSTGINRYASKVNLLQFLDLRKLNLSNTNIYSLQFFNTLEELEEINVSDTKVNRFYPLLSWKRLKKLTYNNHRKHHSKVDKLRQKGVEVIKK